MKSQKLFSLDVEVIANLIKVENASKLVNDLLSDYFFTGQNLKEEEIKANILGFEKEIITKKQKIDHLRKRLELLIKKDKEMKEIFKQIPKQILEDFKEFPKMTEDSLHNRFKTLYSKTKGLKWELVLEAYNKFREET